MIINRELDYALRILRNLSQTELVSATEIERREHIPVAYVRKIVHKLTRMGVTSITRGAYGGYALKIPAEKLTIWSVSQALESEIYMNECLEPGYQCTGGKHGNCKIHVECQRIQQKLEEEMSKTPLSELF